MKDKIIEAHELPNDEKIYLKYNKYLGWAVVYPWKNEDGSINWFNFLTGGTWAKLIITAIIVLMILGFLLEYSNNITHLMSCFNDSVSLQNCKNIYGHANSIIDINNFTLAK